MAKEATSSNAIGNPVFVGRENELKQLKTAFDLANSGRPGVAMIEGEPGIGKTALCRQLATYAEARGGTVLTGHCYEEVSLSLPYLPFVEALRSYALARDVDALREELGPMGRDLARIIPDLRDLLGIDVRQPANPEEGRWRLLQAVSEFTWKLASAQPLLLLLEDLHWADQGTLDLLVHLARNLQGHRILILASYRDVEIDPAHSLSAALVALQRAGGLLRVPLGGLTTNEVQMMYQAACGADVPRRQADLVHRQTEGNPLFVQEVIRYLLQEAVVVQPDGKFLLADGRLVAGMLPRGLRDAIGTRLNGLEERTCEVLSVAAVIGREFRFDVLHRASGLSEEEVSDALEEAQKAGLIEQTSRAGGSLGFGFMHALFREFLYEEVFAARRGRMHKEVARSLENLCAGALEEHAVEILEHFASSTDPENIAKTVEYGELAARHAMSIFAYEEAERHLRQALTAQEMLGPDKTKRCDLLLSLVEALLPLRDPASAAIARAEEAYTLALEIGDSVRTRRASVLAAEALIRAGYPRFPSEFQRWFVRLDSHAEPGTHERIYADIGLGLLGISAGRPDVGSAYLRKAVSRILELGDGPLVFTVSGIAFQRLLGLKDLATLEGLASLVMQIPRQGTRRPEVALSVAGAGQVFLRCGMRPEAESAWQELSILGADSNDRALVHLAAMREAILAFVDGRLKEVVETCSSLAGEAARRGIASEVNLTRPLNYLGILSDEALPNPNVGLQRPLQANRALGLAYLGRNEEAGAVMQTFRGIGERNDETGAPILVNLLEAAILGEEKEMLLLLLPRLSPLADRLSFFPGCSFGTSVARLLGHASVLSGDVNRARSYFSQGLDVCGKVNFRPETALIRLGQAELLLKHYPDERRTAFEHLDFAIAEFEAMEMQPSLDCALRLRGDRAAGREASVHPDRLSEREVEVLRLVSAGKSNREVAEELVLSVRTIERHLANVYAKTGVSNRTSAAAYARAKALI